MKNSRLLAASLVGLLALGVSVSSPAHAKKRSASSRFSRSRMVSNSRRMVAPKVVGRLGQVIQDNSPIYSNPGRKPLYSTVPKETYLILVGQKDDYYAVMMVDGRYGWVSKPRVQLLNYNVTSGGLTGDPQSDFGNKVVHDAFKYLGLRYVWGGYSTSGTDCSGFIKAVFAQNGFSLPRVARDQAQVGQDVPTNELHPGDRVYFSFKGRYIDHTGLYIGNGYFIHNSISNGGVAVDLLTSRRYWSKLVACRR